MAIDFGALNREPQIEEEPTQQPWEAGEGVGEIEEPVNVGMQKADPFDIEPVKKRFAQYKKTVEDMLAQAKAHNIVDQASQAQAVTMSGQARELSRSVTKLKETVTEKHRKFTSSIGKLAKYFVDPLETIVLDLKAKNNEYDYTMLIKEREEAAKEKQRVAMLQKQLDAEAKKAGVESVVLPEIAVNAKPKNITRTESGSTMSVKLVWKGIIVDPALVERSLCSPDQKKIDEAVAGGLRESPGLEIKEVPQSRLRI